jgi:hypothetical protein
MENSKNLKVEEQATIVTSHVDTYMHTSDMKMKTKLTLIKNCFYLAWLKNLFTLHPLLSLHQAKPALSL